jgi:NAD(P)H dehydrogenase (quinone)
MIANSPEPAVIKHCVVVAHPDDDSFTLAVARRYCDEVERQGQQAVLRDLYRIRFDPVLKAEERPGRSGARPQPDIVVERELLAGCAAIVLIYPIWFGTPPAIIKGYVERVLGAGLNAQSLTHHLGQPLHPLLGGKRLLSFTSSGTSRKWLADQGAWLSLQTIFDGYLARVFWMDTPRHVHFEEISAGLDPARAERHLAQVAKVAVELCRRLAAEKPAPSPV